MPKRSNVCNKQFSDKWSAKKHITLTNSVHEKKGCEILNQLKKGQSQVNVTFVMVANHYMKPHS